MLRRSPYFGMSSHERFMAERGLDALQADAFCSFCVRNLRRVNAEHLGNNLAILLHPERVELYRFWKQEIRRMRNATRPDDETAHYRCEEA